MSDEWTTFNVKYFAIPMTALVFGLVIGFGLARETVSKKPTKDYPIEVLTYSNRKDIISYTAVDADSVIGDSIFKDGNMIVNRNIVNVVFK